MKQVRWLVFGLALCVASCGGGGLEPSGDDFATGTWEGPFTDDDTRQVAGSIRLVIRQQDNGIFEGTATFNVPTVPAGQTGTISGSVVPGTTPPQQSGISVFIGGSCPADFAMPSAFTSRTLLEGRIAGFEPACGIEVFGSFALTKK